MILAVLSYSFIEAPLLRWARSGRRRGHG
jgi:peptidoglycan/LPS O-acetylase OafA/YrhL